MLTQNEKEWLAERNEKFFFSCRYCPGRDKQTRTSVYGCIAFCDNSKLLSSCAATTNELRFFQDAAEFEARVAAKLASLATAAKDSNDCFDCPCTQAGVCYAGIRQECPWIFLKTARLMVEEEMDAESKRA